MKIAILISALYKYYCYYYYYCTIKDGAQTYDFIADKSCLLLSIILKVLSGSEVIRIQGKCTKSYKNFWKDFVVKQNLTRPKGGIIWIPVIGCWNQRKLKALIPCVAVALKNLGEWSVVGGEKDFAVFFIFLRSCGRKICVNMCPYLLRICLIYGTNVSVSRNRIELAKILKREHLVVFSKTFYLLRNREKPSSTILYIILHLCPKL